MKSLEDQKRAVGFTWVPSREEWPALQEPDKHRSIWRAKKIFADIVHDITHLEGNPFTVPEIQTLLEGITVGGHKIADSERCSISAIH